MILYCRTRNMRGYKPVNGGKHVTMSYISTTELNLNKHWLTNIHYSKIDTKYYTEIMLDNVSNLLISRITGNTWAIYLEVKYMVLNCSYASIDLANIVYDISLSHHPTCISSIHTTVTNNVLTMFVTSPHEYNSKNYDDYFYYWYWYWK